MNKHQKEKSREIRDIMRASPYKGSPVSPWLLGRMSYKQAKREWKRGIRAFRLGNMWIWKVADLSHLGFNRAKLREVGLVYYKIYEYCIRNGLTFVCEYESVLDAYLLRFTGWLPDGQKYGMGHLVPSDVLRQCIESLEDVVEYFLNIVDREFTNAGYIPHRTTIASMYPSIIRKPDSLEPRMTIHPWDFRSPEAVFGKIIVKE